MQLASIKKKRKVFGWFFMISLFIFILTNLYFFKPNATPVIHHPDNSSTTPIPSPVKDSSNTLAIVSVISLLTSLTSLIGFFSTTFLAWRKEKRETVMSNLEIQKKELEIEKMRFELNNSKAQEVKKE
jgi:hypothetical protein